MEYIWKSEDHAEGDFNSNSNFLLGYFRQEEAALIYEYDGELLRIDAWGKNSLRVRATKMCAMPQEDWVLTEPVCAAETLIEIGEYSASITNGKIKAVVNNIGKLFFYNQKGELLLEEYVRDRKDILAKTSSSLEVTAREFRPILGGDYELSMRFESAPEEKIFGMGQYQQAFLDVKGAELELAHRNSQASVPFMISSLGYGFLWNNPAIGKVSFNNMERQQFKGITPFDLENTYGLFGIHDTSCNTYDLFHKYYKNAQRFDGEHQLNEKVLKAAVLPLVKQILEL